MAVATADANSDVRTVSVMIHRPAAGSTTPDAVNVAPSWVASLNGIGPSCLSGKAAVAVTCNGLGPADNAIVIDTGPCLPGSIVTVASRPPPIDVVAVWGWARVVASAARPGGSATRTAVTASTTSATSSSAKTERRIGPRSAGSSVDAGGSAVIA